MHPIDAMHRHATAATLDATVSICQTALDSVEAADTMPAGITRPLHIDTLAMCAIA